MALPGHGEGLHLDIEDWQADPVVGAVISETGEPVPFVGWLGLISAVEALRPPEPGSADQLR